MKKLFVVLLGWWTAWLPMSICYGQSSVTNVHEVAQSSWTVYSINIPSHTPVDVASTTAGGILYGAFGVEVYNVAASTVNLNCGFNASVSTQPTSNFYGREIPPGSAVYFGLAPAQNKIFCQGAGSQITTKATITQIK